MKALAPRRFPGHPSRQALVRSTHLTLKKSEVELELELARDPWQRALVTVDQRMLSFVASQHAGVLATLKRDGRPQLSNLF